MRLIPSLVLFLATFCSCAHYKPFSGERVYIDNFHKKTCALHHIHLINAKAFRIDDKIIIDPTPKFIELHAAYPNSVSIGTSLVKNSDYNIPIDIEYCTECQSQVQHLMK